MAMFLVPIPFTRYAVSGWGLTGIYVRKGCGMDEEIRPGIPYLCHRIVKTGYIKFGTGKRYESRSEKTFLTAWPSMRLPR